MFHLHSKDAEESLMRKVVVIILILLLLSGCKTAGPEMPIAAAPQTGLLPTPEDGLPVPDPATTNVPAPTRVAMRATETPTTASTLVQTPLPTEAPAAETTASATPAVDRPLAIALELAQAVPPVRDDLRLAIAYRGLDDAALPTPAASVVEPLAAGTRQQFNVLDVVNNQYGEIEAELLAVGDHAYFWFETGSSAITPDENTLASVVSAFDEIYAGVTAIYGSENSPGIDGDPRLHVLHASPQSICGVPAESQGGCGTAGFVSASDLQMAALNPGSNEREMFVMNDRQFGGDYYLGVLAHEFRHMIEFNYDMSDTDWEKEGSSVLATELVGLPSSGVDRANAFLSNPDQQLNSWTEVGKGAYYGQGYLFNQYIYDRLGESLYREFATSPLPGFVALDALAERHDLGYSAQTLWLDWQAALALHEHPQAAEEHQISAEGLVTAAMTTVDTLPAELAGDVRQYAADYYQLPPGAATVAFEGTDTVPLLAGQGGTDDAFWFAQRANYSNPRLTRVVDLRDVAAATLAYDVYTDIEYGYDFAYVSLSSDGGKTWDALAATSMQGLDPADDPSNSALAPRFYTGRTQAWRHEIIDLTPYVGQEVLLRFEMVTDPILTYSGLAVDNVAIPEIGYFDDGSKEGWTAEGFTLAGSSLPQPWHLQLITFGDEGPIIETVSLSDGGQTLLEVSSEPGQRRPILVVAASAPVTLQPAAYSLRIS